MIKYFESMIESELFEGIPKAHYLDVFDSLHVTGRKYHEGEIVFCEGAIIDSICIVNRGSVIGEKTHTDGEVHIIEFYGEGDIFALETTVSRKKKSPMDYMCNEDSVIVFIPLKEVNACKYEAEIKEVILRKIADDNIKKMKKIEIVAERGLRERILIYFNILKNRYGSSEFTVKMNREQLAQYLCVNRSALSNELNKMKREKIIDWDKDRFRLL